MYQKEERERNVKTTQREESTKPSIWKNDIYPLHVQQNTTNT
jgi:hypothetical protein